MPAAQHPQTQAEWEQAMARRILSATRSELYLQFRYLNVALCALDWKPVGGLSAFATDGVSLCYTPEWLLTLYQKNRRYLPRAFLHSVLHCVFRHLWLRGGRDRALWGLACDIVTEHLLDTLDAPVIRRPVGWLRQQTYAALQKSCPVLAAGPVYRALCQAGRAGAESPLPPLQKLRQEFTCDSHALWPNDPEAPAAQAAGQRWEQLGRETQLSMQQDGRLSGSDAGAEALAAQVQAGHSRRLYRDFLRRFAVWREEPRLSPDEFDPGYYAYGLRIYGNLPLIEPLETRESKKVWDLAIVLDTSDSTSGALVKAFLRETFTLLKSSESFFNRCRICVLQADNAVRGETLLTNLSALERYMQQFTLRGGGGTDFRPAFARIEELRADGTLPALKGVLYFTDGKGVYPARRPGFDTAFLFVEQPGTAPPEVPPWAMRLVLSPEELLPEEAPPVFAAQDAADIPEMPEL